jgi:phosphotriesterase-related protein
VADIHRFIMAQVREGLDGTDVLPGFIGEVGSSNPVTSQEERVLRAAAQVGAETGTMVAVHLTTPGREAPAIVDLLLSEGLPANRIVLCHMDEVLDEEYHRSVLDRGATVEFDTFGFEGYFARLWKTPSDGEKMTFLARLVELGYRDQIVLGHDVALKCQLQRFGGLGYDHLIKRIVPTLRGHLGFAQEDVDALIVHNPRRLLARSGDGSAYTKKTSR